MVRTALAKAFMLALILAVFANRCVYPSVEKMQDCATHPEKYGKAFARQCDDEIGPMPEPKGGEGHEYTDGIYRGLAHLQAGASVKRRAYHKAYYARTAERRCRLAEHRRQMKRWTAWLLTELRTNWPPEPQPVFAADLRDARLEYR